MATRTRVSNREFEMNGRRFHSMMDIARELGLPRIYPKEFGKYGIVEVTGQPQDITQPTVNEEVVSEDKQVDVVKNDDKSPADKKGKTKKSESKEKKADIQSVPKKKVYTVEELVKMPLADFSKHMRKVDTDDIIAFAKSNKLDVAEDATDIRIRRMKVVMDIKAKFFPNQTLPAKKSSFKGVDLDELIAFAKKNKVEFKKSSEDKIQRMWVIYALNQSGFYDLPNKPEKETVNGSSEN